MIKSELLSNGIRVVAQEMPGYHSASIGVWVRTGAVNEKSDIAGISHLIEHMMFKGTKERSASDIAAEMDGVGGQINAFTSKECTCYHATVTDEHIDMAAKLLADMVLNSVYDEGEMQKEKGVITEEISMIEDSPEDMVHDLHNEVFFAGHNNSNSILGTRETVSSLSRANIVDYLKLRYTSDKVVIAVAGNINMAELKPVLEEAFFALPKPSGKTDDLPEFIRPKQKIITVREKDNEQVHLCVGFPGVALSVNIYPLYILNNLFGGSMSSRLFQRIREERGLTYSIYSYPSTYTSGGMYSLYAATRPDQTKEVIELSLKEIRQLSSSGVTKEEFLRAKDQLKGNFILGSESVGGRASNLGKNMTLLDRVITVEENIRLIEAVTPDDVNALLEKIFDEESLCATFIGRVDKAEAEGWFK
ncbi:MAG: M16 family metallopeptidase [Christensenellales bacterium]|jgi:predicted Zn-dependent peptidase